MINKNKNMKAKAFGGLGIAVFLLFVDGPDALFRCR